jgi:hypothetical protein
MWVVDTNVLLYAVNRDAPDHDRCLELLETFRRQPSPWYLTWGIIYEFIRVATHPRVFRQPWSLATAWSFLEALLAAPNLSVLVAGDAHQHVAGQVFNEMPDICSNLVFDARTAILMREHGIRTIYTRDVDFNRFPFLEVVDPVRPT